jgi:O-acetyl-ADP-ribose deacetylase (regulator of RNase III)
LVHECRLLGGCKTGQARMTRGYRLPAKHIIHTVGPVWRGGGHGEPDLLAQCYRSCFALARQHGLQTLAFPAISCGIYRFPIDRAAAIAVQEAAAALAQHGDIKQVVFACFDDAVRHAYREAIGPA